MAKSDEEHSSSGSVPAGDHHLVRILADRVEHQSRLLDDLLNEARPLLQEMRDTMKLLQHHVGQVDEHLDRIETVARALTLAEQRITAAANRQR